MNTHYYVTLESGRSFVLKSSEVWYTAAYDANEEAKLMDDSLVDLIPVDYHERRIKTCTPISCTRRYGETSS